MDYEENKHSEMSKTGYITVIVLCLLAIGAVSYFAISGMKAKVDNRDKTSSDNKSYSSDNGTYSSDYDTYSSDDKAYSSNDSSYNSSVTEPEIDISTPSSSVDKAESEIPYEESSKPTKKASKESGFILPVKGNVSKGYSDTALQYSATYGDMRLHTGIDILCKTGTDVKSAADGTVISVEESATLGRVITVDHGGDLTVKYCGFESVNVKESDSVKCGDVLGTAGTVPSEANDQPHIHVELYQAGEISSPLIIFGKEQ
ncbi:MAG: M23 family metallopeptidase [Clostridia bacterium]|nr:M23 family metallopeptidase [Clostridia bacterium]